MGVAYYRTLKAKSKSTKPSHTRLAIDAKDPLYKQPVDRKLLEALSFLKLKKPCRSALKAWLDSAKSATQKDINRELHNLNKFKWGGGVRCGGRVGCGGGWSCFVVWLGEVRRSRSRSAPRRPRTRGSTSTPSSASSGRWIWPGGWG